MNKLPLHLRQIAIAARCKNDIEAFRNLLQDLEEEDEENSSRSRYFESNKYDRRSQQSPPRTKRYSEHDDKPKNNSFTNETYKQSQQTEHFTNENKILYSLSHFTEQ